MKVFELRHEFVDSAPDPLEPGVLYVSIKYSAALHLCCCGCGQEVVLPLNPTGWRVTYDGATVSLSPSVGNWSLPCRSHYWIERDRVRWAGPWTNEQIATGRRRTLEARDATEDAFEELSTNSPKRRRGRLGRVFGR